MWSRSQRRAQNLKNKLREAPKSRVWISCKLFCHEKVTEAAVPPYMGTKSVSWLYFVCFVTLNCSLWNADQTWLQVRGRVHPTQAASLFLTQRQTAIYADIHRGVKVELQLTGSACLRTVGGNPCSHGENMQPHRKAPVVCQVWTQNLFSFCWEDTVLTTAPPKTDFLRGRSVTSWTNLFASNKCAEVTEL